MEELIELLERATGPDQGLNLMIAESVYGRQSQGGTGSTVGALDYTGSIDHALTLIPEGCDYVSFVHDPSGSGWEIGRFQLSAERDEDRYTKMGFGVTGGLWAIALCIAALKARAELVTSDNAALTTNSEGKP